MGADPSSILATTFSKKAAGEIRDRIIETIATAVLDEEKRDELSRCVPQLDHSQEGCSAILRTILSNLHRLEIGTIDSFFVKSALAFSDTLELSQNWEILDESGNALLFATADKCSDAQILKFSGETETIVLKKTTPFNTPSEFSFYPAHPNPFNPVTTIRFSTKTDSHLSLRIYDITGKLVETLVEEKISTGNHTVRWNAEKFSSGMYFVQFQNSGKVQTQKIILLK